MPPKGQSASVETREKLRQKALQQWSERRNEMLSSINRSEVREKISRAMSRPEARERISCSNRTRVVSISTRKKMSRSNLGKTLGHPPYGGGYVKWIEYKKNGRIIKLQGTYELEVAKYLDEIGEEWECTNCSKEHSFLLSDESRYYPDFYLKRLDLYIDPKGWIRPENEKKYKLLEAEYLGRCKILLGETYLEQLKEVLNAKTERV